MSPGDTVLVDGADGNRRHAVLIKKLSDDGNFYRGMWLVQWVEGPNDGAEIVARIVDDPSRPGKS